MKIYKPDIGSRILTKVWFGAYLSTGEDFELRPFFTWAYNASIDDASPGLCGLLLIVLVLMEEYEEIPAKIDSESHV